MEHCTAHNTVNQDADTSLIVWKPVGKSHVGGCLPAVNASSGQAEPLLSKNSTTITKQEGTGRATIVQDTECGYTMQCY